MPDSPAVITEGRNSRITDADPLASDWERIWDVTTDFQLDGEVVYADVILVDWVAEIGSKFLSDGILQARPVANKMLKRSIDRQF
jgi:hypothetical protein